MNLDIGGSSFLDEQFNALFFVSHSSVHDWSSTILINTIHWHCNREERESVCVVVYIMEPTTVANTLNRRPMRHRYMYTERERPQRGCGSKMKDGENGER